MKGVKKNIKRYSDYIFYISNTFILWYLKLHLLLICTIIHIKILYHSIIYLKNNFFKFFSYFSNSQIIELREFISPCIYITCCYDNTIVLVIYKSG